MSNATKIKKYMDGIISAIDRGEANETKTLKALAKGILLLAEDLENLNKKEAAKDFGGVGSKSSPFGGMFGGDIFGRKG